MIHRTDFAICPRTPLPEVKWADGFARIAGLEAQLDATRAEVRRLTDERAKAIAERDEARQMHKERVFYDRKILEEQLDEKHRRWLKLHEAAQAIMRAACPVPGWIASRLAEAIK